MSRLTRNSIARAITLNTSSGALYASPKSLNRRVYPLYIYPQPLYARAYPLNDPCDPLNPPPRVLYVMSQPTLNRSRHSLNV